MRIILEISYVGTNYHGWQKQKNKISIAETIESAFENKFGEKISLTGSGRTDAGVHAISQVAHFETSINVKAEKIGIALNTVLPNDIRINRSFEANKNFHARFDAKSKTYLYSTYYSSVENVFKINKSLQLKQPLNIEKMEEVAKILIGEHDFSCFCKTSSKQKDCVRKIFNIKIINNGNNETNFEISGNGFLHNMVRILVSTLIDAGLGKINTDDVKNLLEKHDRKFASKTLPAYALYLKEVKYWQIYAYVLKFKRKNSLN